MLRSAYRPPNDVDVTRAVYAQFRAARLGSRGSWSVYGGSKPRNEAWTISEILVFSTPLCWSSQT
jgi:hypothetical protein